MWIFGIGVFELLGSPYPRTLVPILVAAGAFLGFIAWFFRDPDRATAQGLVSPADGRVRGVAREGEWSRISIFMNVTDVHVNRFPLDAQVREVGDAGKGHRPAYGSEADRNVQRRYTLDAVSGPIELVQITGIFARRLVSFVQPGDRRTKGSRLGMIVLGSRVDVRFAAARFSIQVQPGQHVKAGETTLAMENA